MRLWSLHPCYLDAKGLVALWREALRARAVLRGETRATSTIRDCNVFARIGIRAPRSMPISAPCMWKRNRVAMHSMAAN